MRAIPENIQTYPTREHISYPSYSIPFFFFTTCRLTTIYSPVPHSLHQASHTSICLITADPQRRYKDLVADDQFPASLRPLVTRVLGVSKLKAKFKSFESRRQLAAEHTHFFVDERVITAMPFLLGKAFYKSSAKRPIPVRLTGHANRRVDKELAAKAKKDRRAAGNKESALFGTPAEIGREIEKALSSALVNLAVSTSTAVRVGFASWAPERVSENVEAVVKGMLEPREDGAAVKIVPGGWRNVRSIYLKGTKTTALPLWLADELWTDEADVVEHQKEEGETTTTSKKRKPVDGAETVAPSSSAKKSKVAAAPAVVTEETKEKENKPAVTEKKEKTEKKQSAAAKAKAALESDVAARKEKIKAQRNKAMRKLIK